MGGEEHVVGLDDGADEEAGEREDGETEAFCEVLVCESLSRKLVRLGGAVGGVMTYI